MNDDMRLYALTPDAEAEFAERRRVIHNAVTAALQEMGHEDGQPFRIEWKDASPRIA